MNVRCPKCQSNNTYFDGVDNACRTCGERWPKSLLHFALKEALVATKPNKRCKNCGREKKIISDDLCSGCYSTVYRKHSKGTPEYVAALAAAKERFTLKAGSTGKKHLV